VIDIQNVHKVYNGPNGVAALKGVHLHIPAGSIFGVLGQSGAGKSTLIRCVNLLERPTSGSIIVDGQDLTQLSPAQLRAARQRIGMIFQHFNLLNSRTVAQNVAFPLEIIGYKPAARRARVAELLDLVGLSDKAEAYPSQLSGGQKQRVGIARALAAEPKVLLSDEATSALDPQTTRSILELLRSLNERLGLTILLITHEMSVVRQICDRVAILEHGEVVEQGKVSELLAQANSRLAQAIFPKFDAYSARPGAVVATLTFTGSSAEQPVLSQLARQFMIDANVLAGNIESIGNQRIGQLQVELMGDQIEQAISYLRGQGVRVEVQA
jgi:ABC-type metal ion transport system, ATPase component